jgi:hypothetical protein
VTVELGGQLQKAWKFLLRSMYSGRDFVWLYRECDQLAFFDGHVRAFAALGGVPHRLIYDNLSSAVKRRTGLLQERELTVAFRALVSHYLFEPCFARPREGHDKGGVEARGKAIRLQHLTPIPGLDATAHVGVETIRFACNDEQIEVAKECRGARMVRYRHYLPELARKPQAVRQVAPELIAELGEPYSHLWSLLVGRHGEREASRILARIVGAIVDHGEAAVAGALRQVIDSVNGERPDLVEYNGSSGSGSTPPLRIEVPPALAAYTVQSSRASDYDWLLKGSEP